MEESTSLSTLIMSVQNSLQNKFPLPVWVVAEISELNINRSGHCYLELIEKDVLSDKIIAKSRATIWAFVFRMIRPYFETTTGESLKSGLKVLIKASVEFHEVYGFSLNISDIDPQYTVGEMAMKRTRIIQQLYDDGVVDMNKMIHFPFVPQQIAVISSETAAGYEDFKTQLNSNAFEFGFMVELFPAIMQGDKAPQSIISAFESVYEQIEKFDLVVLLRGGGSKSDLSCFDDYELAYYITQFPLPVITGIGHERDDSVCDLVAHTRLKTPTAVAEYLVKRMHDFKSKLDELLQKIIDVFEETIETMELNLVDQTQRLNYTSYQIISSNMHLLDLNHARIKSGKKLYLYNKLSHLNYLADDFKRMAKNKLFQEADLCNRRALRLRKWIHNYWQITDNKLLFMENRNRLANPQHILDRGFSIVTSNGKIVIDPNEIKGHSKIAIRFAKGSISGKLTKDSAAMDN